MPNLSFLLSRYYAFLAQEQQRISQSIAMLEQAGCQDEAILEKVRLNIVSIFETVCLADEKHTACEANAEAAFYARFLPRFQAFSIQWKSKLEKARAHGDISACAIEETKLETANHLEEAFLSLKG